MIIKDKRQHLAIMMYQAGYPIKDITKETGYSHGGLDYYLTKYHVPSRTTKRKLIPPLYPYTGEKFSARELVKRFDVPFESLSPRAKKLVIKYGGKEYII